MKKVIYDCSNYETEQIFTDISYPTINELSYNPVESSSGLCKHCDFENECSIHEFGTVIFSCEQYQ